MPTLRDRFWVWGHEAGSYTHTPAWPLPRPSRMTPAEAAWYLGVPNALMVNFGGLPTPDTFDLHARALSPLQQVVWSIIGDSSSTRNDNQSDLDPVLALAAQFPNITGAIMDDFFHAPDAAGVVSRVSVAQLADFHAALHAVPRPLDLWVVLYRHDLDFGVQDHLAQCDVVNFWTWEPRQLANLEANFAKVEALAPTKRKVLGCYMYDFDAGQEMPLDLMAHQCTLGRQWLHEGRIDGMVFLASCISDLGFAAVEWTKRWIAEVGDQPL